MPKPKFDPSQPFEPADEKPKFDPSKPYDAVSEPLTLKGAAESVGAGLASGIYNAPLMGVARRSGAAVNAGLESILDAQRAPADRKSFGDRYDQILAEDAAAQAKREREHPTASKVGNVAVSASMAALPLPFGKVPGAAGAALRTGSTAGLAGLDAATQGQNVDLEKAKQEATLGAGLQGGLEAAGGTLGLVGKAAKPAVDKVSKYISDLAEKRALKASLGRGGKALDDLEAFKKTGKVARDVMNPNEFVSEPVVQFGNKIEDVSKRSTANKDTTWAVVEGIHDKVDKLTDGQSVDGTALAQNILARASKIEPLPGNLPTIDKMKENAAYFQAKGKFSLQEAQKFKNEFQFKRENPVSVALGKDGNNQIRKAFTEEMGNAISAVDSGEDLKNWKKANSLYGTYNTVEKAAKKESNANIKNRMFSASDYGMASTGALLGAVGSDDDSRAQNVLLGAAAGLGNKIMRQRGPTASAVLLDKISKTLQQSPETYGRFRSLIEKAAKQGSPALIGAHLMVQQSQGKGENEAIRPD
jgi:hypothetical protein